MTLHYMYTVYTGTNVHWELPRQECVYKCCKHNKINITIHDRDPHAELSRYSETF